MAAFYPPPWCYPAPQPAVKPQSSSSSASDSDSSSSGGDSSTSSQNIKKQEFQLHRGASFVMKLPKVCFRPAHFSPGPMSLGASCFDPPSRGRNGHRMTRRGLVESSWKVRLQDLLQEIDSRWDSVLTAEAPVQDLCRALWICCRTRPNTRVVHFRARTYKDCSRAFRFIGFFSVGFAERLENLGDSPSPGAACVA